jgi:hypothetical protein
MFTMRLSPVALFKFPFQRHYRHAKQATDADGRDFPAPRGFVRRVSAEVEVAPSGFGDGEGFAVVAHDTPPPFIPAITIEPQGRVMINSLYP